MSSKSNATLLKNLIKIVEKIESELSECKKIIELLESIDSEESTKFSKSSKTDTLKKGDITPVDLHSIVTKIEAEFKENKFDSLSWLVSSGSKINKDDIIAILKEGGIILPKSTNKGKISDEVKQILSARYSFSKS